MEIADRGKLEINQGKVLEMVIVISMSWDQPAPAHFEKAPKHLCR
jgi:hypothetical protein